MLRLKAALLTANSAVCYGMAIEHPVMPGILDVTHEAVD